MAKCEPWLADRINAAGGALTFEQFMTVALYDAEHGYYAAQVGDVGNRGDFSTSATLCPSFAEAIARWASKRAAQDFADGDFALIEVGAGNGQLAENFVKAWREVRTAEQGSAPYIAVETSERLRVLLAERAAICGFEHVNNLPAALERVGGKAIIFHNELVDVFPARQLCWDGADWMEVGVRLEGDKLVEGLLPFMDPVDADAPAEPRPGQRIFIHPTFHTWLETQLAGWRKGRMLTIDYGAGYPAGECRGYRAQKRIEGDEIYGKAGQQDLTCDVNFADLQRWGEQLGWTTVARQTQSDFLAAWLPDIKARAEADEVLAFIGNPFAAGGAFLALEQQRG